MKKINFTICLIFFLSYSFYAHSNIKIKYKIENQIITNVDILEEKRYITFLRPNLKNISKDEISKIAENSLIREIIKKKELDTVFRNLENQEITSQIKKSLIDYVNVKNETELVNLLKKNKIDYDKIILKMKYERLWNQLIFSKFNPLVKIDKIKLSQQLKKKISSNKKYEYNLSELLFEIDKNEKLNKKYKEIFDYIKLNNFKLAVFKYSISDSSKKGGEIGWIKETLLSDDLNSILLKMKVDEISKPLKYPNGYLVLKINDKKEMKQTINFNNELEELIRYERNRQLNQFSLLYFKKLKQNTLIDEK